MAVFTRDVIIRHIDPAVTSEGDKFLTADNGEDGVSDPNVTFTCRLNAEEAEGIEVGQRITISAVPFSVTEAGDPA